jgi:hypothetical protein
MNLMNHKKGGPGFVGKTIEFFNPMSDGAQLANDFVSAAIKYLLIPLGELGGRGGNVPFGGGRWLRESIMMASS